MSIARDARLIYVAAFLRAASVGIVGVVLAIYLGDAGLPISATGVLIGVGLTGAALATVLVTVFGDRLGRRRVLIGVSMLTAVGYVALAASTTFGVLAVFAFAGMLNGMGRDRGAASVVEQAILPETTVAERRTWSLAWYNLGIDLGHATGALAGMTPILLTKWFALDRAQAHRSTFLICAALSVIGALLYTGLSDRIEIRQATDGPARAARLETSARRSIVRLAALFGIDSIGGGFLSSALIAYWFFERYGLTEAQLATMFFAARVLNAASHVLAAWLARRIGLVNTMVLTHLPSSVLLLLAPLSESGLIAAIMFLAREALVEMDVPTRQSYVMAIVRPGERTFASGVTNVTRTVGWAIGPSVAGFVMQHVLAAPLFIGGTLKIGYDLALYRAFRHVRPPEEVRTPV